MRGCALVPDDLDIVTVVSAVGRSVLSPVCQDTYANVMQLHDDGCSRGVVLVGFEGLLVRIWNRGWVSICRFVKENSAGRL